jgi:Tuberculosis necrotizing toxin
MHALLTLLFAPILSAALSIPHLQPRSLQKALLTHETNSTCDCTNTNSSGPPTNPPSICNDPRLGPVEMPRKLPLLSFVSDYDRFGGAATPGEFLAKWTNKTTGGWLWPKESGFSLDVEGRPILGKMVLEVGALVDRFGSEYGTYVSAADAPYDQRSLPPSSLNTPPDALYPYGYHIYNVVKALTVEGGPIAPWFGQPGLGAQFYVGETGNILKLIELGYLERVHKSDVEPGPGGGRGCGW